jgi:hypothetical protein
MKCQEFEPIIINMARGQLTETAARESALAHLERCAGCASAYEEQQALSAGIRVAAESLANQGASARVEEALRFAFRERARRFTAPEIKHRWPRWTVGAAAAAILVVALLIGVTWLKSPPENQKLEAANLPAAPAVESPGQKQNSQPRIERQSNNNQKTARNTAGSRSLNTSRGLRQGAAPDAKVTTRFYSLVEEGQLVPLESGRIVRVEVPVSAMITLGLPITAESMDRTVQADLLVGQDGLARAIRFLP